MIIIIIQEISLAHNLRLKARALCAYRKTQINTYRKKKKEQTEHTRISQLPHRGQSNNLQCKRCRTTARRKKERKKRCTYYKCSFLCIQVDQTLTGTFHITNVHFRAYKLTRRWSEPYVLCSFLCIQVGQMLTRTLHVTDVHFHAYKYIPCKKQTKN